MMKKNYMLNRNIKSLTTIALLLIALTVILSIIVIGNQLKTELITALISIPSTIIGAVSGYYYKSTELTKEEK